MKHRTSHAVAMRKQAGLTLIELAIALAVAAALLFGLFYVVNTANAKRKTSSEVQNLTMMANDIRAKFAGQGDFAGLTAGTLIQLGVPPQSMISGSALSSSFSTPVAVAAANINGQANDGFEFTYTNFPANACADFVMAAASNFAKVTLGSMIIKNIGTGATDTTITVAELAGCAGANGVVPAIRFGQGR